MCILAKTPKLKPLPPTPTAYDKDVQAREDELRASLGDATGTAGTVKTDLVPSQLQGQKRVLLGV